ncbi:MAG TPA: xanthine dehydrogenase [Chloroflexi bacterium]|nr:xanthine dehydrogenase [Chloroflexota bacterium]
MTANIYQQIVEIIKNQGTAALCVIVQASGSTPRGTGSKMLVFPDGRTLDTIGGGELEHRVVQAAHEAMADGEPKLVSYKMTDPKRGDPGVCGGQLEVYVEPILPQPTVIVIGAGHVGREVARLANWLGFAVVVSDDRAEFLTDDLAALGQIHHGPMQDLVSQFKLHSQTYLILTTRNVELDVKGLPALLDSAAAFIGVIGSRRRWQTTTKQLIEQGIEPERLSRVHSPVGLELKAETPEEIAVSILAQIIMLRRSGDGSVMSKA